MEARVSIAFDIEIKSALHVGSAPMGVGEYLYTQQHIPGTALRGALAESLIKKSGMDPNGDTFRHLFEGPQALRFEPAYLATHTDRGYPFPLTARRCKAIRHHKCAFDTLVSQVVFEEQMAALKENGIPLPFIERPLCPHCWGKVEPATDCYVWDDVDGQPGAPPKTELVRHTHTAINRARGVAEDGMLYTIETLEPGTRLHGCLWMEEGQADQVRIALGNVTRVGRGIHRGRGQVRITPRGKVDDDNTGARIKALTELFQTERAFYAKLTGRELPPDGGYYFTLDLLSPAIFGDGVAATLQPDPLDLGEGVEPVRRFVAPETVGGWWKAAGLPHPTAMAAATGSVFLYRAPPETDLSRLSGRLNDLRATGLGCLRERGYGAVMCCAPFHLWAAEKEATRQ